MLLTNDITGLTGCFTDCRQRAEHAMRMYEQRKEMIAELEQRNSDLEQKFAEVTRMNLDAQRVERQLRDELSSRCFNAMISLSLD